MKRFIAMAAALVLMLALPTAAAAKTAHKSSPHVSGTIVSWDEATKQATIKDSAGKETSVVWNDQTKVEGTPKVGEHASVSYMKEKDGKMLATHVHVGAKPPATHTTTTAK
jgi:hypothetical protein